MYFRILSPHFQMIAFHTKSCVMEHDSDKNVSYLGEQ